MSASHREMRLPPHRPEAEAALVAGLFQDPAALGLVSDVVTSQDFYRQDAREVFAAAVALAANGRPFDVVAVAEHLDASGKMAAVGGMAGMGALAGAAGSSANVTHYANLIATAARSRRLIAALAVAAEAAHEQAPEEVSAHMAATLIELEQGREPDRHRPPAGDSLIPTEADLDGASLSPRCIVKHCLYADVAALVAPGGTGKTTLLIHEAVHIALGWPVWGLPVEAPGWTLFVTAEDRREQFMARLREILASLDLTPVDRARALWGVRVWDTTGEAVKLIRAADGNVILTRLADDIVETYRADSPAVVVFDPLVSFGASEGMINDNEQGIITAARRIVKGLNCCVRLVHHTGKGNAREGTLDQYAGRGGSALADGSRMMSVLQTWTPDAPGNRQPPPGCTPGPDVAIALLARAKLSYAPPNLPVIWIRREGFAFAHFIEEPKPAPAELRAAHAEQLDRFIRAELERGRFHTQKTLEEQAGIMGMARQAIREALSELRISGRLIDAPSPKELCRGGRKTHLRPPDNLAASFGEVGPKKCETDPETSPTSPPPTTSPPYREENHGEVVPWVPSPDPCNIAATNRRGSARLAKNTDSVVIEEIMI